MPAFLNAGTTWLRMSASHSLILSGFTRTSVTSRRVVGAPPPSCAETKDVASRSSAAAAHAQRFDRKCIGFPLDGRRRRTLARPTQLHHAPRRAHPDAKEKG